jgi:hypothetical protein
VSLRTALYALLCLGLVTAAPAAGRTADGQATGSAAGPEDVPGWRGAGWGMTEAELEDAFGEDLAALPGRWQYGGAYATRALFGVPLGGIDFTAYFQMNARTDRLQQVLLEGLRRRAGPEAFAQLLDALEARYGAPDGTCVVPKAGGQPLLVEYVWTFPTTTVHATLMDFYTTSMFFEDPQAGTDPLQPLYERRRNNPRFLPRRVTVRLHPTDRTDLLSRLECVPPTG